MNKTIAIFFDIGNTLAIPVISNDSLQELKVFPFIHEVLTKLKDNPDYRLGIISNTLEKDKLPQMQTILFQCDLLPMFDPNLMLFSSVEKMDKKQKAFFDLAVKRAKIPASDCIYVGEDQAEREMAAKAGLQVSFHPLHLFHVLGQL